MEGTDTHILDGNLSHDHTFYGNGCENEWKNTPPDYNGSGKSCSTRIVQTKDGENQKNGTYYNFQAATSGVGSTLSADNANSDDTFCPLGWQLPYSGTGGDYYNKTRSWKFIFGKYTIQSNSSGATKLMSYPISYVSSGNFNWSSGGLFSQGVLGLYWSSTSISSTNTYRMVHSASSINDSDSGFRALGQAVRCVLGISNLESFPWHPRSLISIMAFHFLKAHFPSVKIMSNYLKNETKYFIFMELRANFDEAESKYKMENRILMGE